MHSDARRLTGQIFWHFVDCRTLLTGNFFHFSCLVAHIKKKKKSTEQISPSKTVVCILPCDLPNHSLVSLSLPLSSNRSWSSVDGGGGEWWARHLWPFAAFCGLYYPCVIVLRDLDNHNRRRAGKPQSSGRNEGQLMVGGGKKNVTFIVCMGEGEGMGDGKKGLSWVFCTNSGFVVGFWLALSALYPWTAHGGDFGWDQNISTWHGTGSHRRELLLLLSQMEVNVNFILWVAHVNANHKRKWQVVGQWRKTEVVESLAASAECTSLKSSFKAQLMHPAHLYSSISKGPFSQLNGSWLFCSSSNKLIPGIKEVNMECTSVQLNGLITLH